MKEVRVVHEGTCEWEEGCTGEVVAVVGLPSAHALKVCDKHFDVWLDGEQKRHQEAPNA